jgi:hypothetical protein
MTSQGQGDQRAEASDDLLREKSNIIRQVSELLESRRLESQDGPFRGFRSPPGASRLA